MMLPWILGGCAVAYLIWSRPPRAVGLPALLPSASIPPLLSPPPPAGGVPPVLLAAMVLPWGLVAFQFLQGGPPPPAPAPAPPAGIDLRGAFTSPEDAVVISALLAELADVIEWDGRQPEPRLKTAAAFDDLRRAARESRTRGVSIGSRNPSARSSIESYLLEKLGPSGGPVDPGQRLSWVSAFRDVSRAAGDAAR
ncbi:hypothetical protein UFOVP1124_27 [uncultured Caudovirales phage]|uniref:Uncharacterized protein n=1 Tax=uncultured Caudovirales phage TaxID=2100421 RepID=A0A6J5QJ56_9CAUD|nr:hypothetical protein UFOVP1124_27 [uncultured Caudovirales phage]